MQLCLIKVVVTGIVLDSCNIVDGAKKTGIDEKMVLYTSAFQPGLILCGEEKGNNVQKYMRMFTRGYDSKKMDEFVTLPLKLVLRWGLKGSIVNLCERVPVQYRFQLFHNNKMHKEITCWSRLNANIRHEME